MSVTTVVFDLVGHANDLDWLVLLDDTTLDTTGRNSATAGDGEDVLDGHQEGHDQPLRSGVGMIVVDCVHELLDAGILGSVGVVGFAETERSAQSRWMMGMSSPGKS